MHACVAVYSAAYIGSDGKSRKPEEAGSTAGQTLKLVCVLFELKSVVRVFVCASPGPGLEEASCQARSGGRQGRQGKTCDFHDPEAQSGQAPKSSSASRKRPAATLETSAETAAKRPADTLETSAETTVKKRPAATLETSAETTRPPTLEDLQAGFFLCLYIYICIYIYIYIKLSPLNPYIGLVNPSFCVETDLQEEDSGLEATWEACQAAEAAFQARKTKPEPEPGQGKPEPGNDGLGLV